MPTVASDTKCWCGKPIHYADERLLHQVAEVIERFGQFLNVRTDAGTFRVQRHYIALHGIRDKDLRALGFEAV